MSGSHRHPAIPPSTSLNLDRLSTSTPTGPPSSQRRPNQKTAMKAPSSSSTKKTPMETPLAELTNNLIPFSSLANLCNSTLKPSTTFNAPPDSSPVTGKENRIPKTVFNIFSSKSTSYKPARAQSASPSLRVAPPPTPPLGEAGTGEHSYNLRRSDVNYKEAIDGSPDSFVVENDRHKENSIPSSRPIILDRNLGTVVPSSHPRPSVPAKFKDKGSEIDVTPSQPALLQTKKDKGKAIAVTPTQPDPQMTTDKGVMFVSPSDELKRKDKAISSFSDTPKVKGIEIGGPAVASGSRYLTRHRDKRKASSMSSRHPIIMNVRKGKLKETGAPSNVLPSNTKNKDALLTPLNLCSKKADHKEKSIPLPSDCQPPFKPSENLVKEMEIFTCPPLPRTRSSRKRTTKDEDSKLPKSWTDPHPKKPKSRRVKKEADQLDFLPRDFVEKYNAYFKEVDEFELPEEEISGDDLDKD